MKCVKLFDFKSQSILFAGLIGIIVFGISQLLLGLISFGVVIKYITPAIELILLMGSGYIMLVYCILNAFSNSLIYIGGNY